MARKPAHKSGRRLLLRGVLARGVETLFFQKEGLVYAPRIAALLRELADELEATDAPDIKPRRRRARSVPLVKPTGRCEPTDLDRARADALIRKHYGR